MFRHLSTPPNQAFHIDYVVNQSENGGGQNFGPEIGPTAELALPDRFKPEPVS